MHFIQKSATGALGLSRGAVWRRDGIFLRTEDQNPMGSHACASHATRGAVGAAQGARPLARLKLLYSHAIPRQGARPPARRAPRRDPPRGGPYASRGTIHRGETPHGSSGTARASGAAAHLSAAGARRFPRRCAPRAHARAPCSSRRSLRPTSRRPTNTHSERARVGRFSTMVWWWGGPLRIFCVWLVPYACFERVDRGNW